MAPVVKKSAVNKHCIYLIVIIFMGLMDILFELNGLSLTSVINMEDTDNLQQAIPTKSTIAQLPFATIIPTHTTNAKTKARFFGYVTILITSCGRWDELSISIESIEKYNTYPYINNRIVMDD